MNKLLSFISTIGIRATDKEQEILNKHFLVYQALLMSVGGVVWGILAISINRVWQSSIPFSYVVLSVINLTYFHYSQHTNIAKNIQTGLSLLLPFVFQWVLGGFVASGAVMLWAILSLASSVTYQSIRTMSIWLLFYIILTIFSGVFDQQFYNWIKPFSTAEYSIVLMALNISLISIILLWLFGFVVRGQNHALQRLREAQAQLVQSEKMATLGTLAAGVAHELNNPAAASGRASKQLNEVLIKAENARDVVIGLALTGKDRDLANTLTKQARDPLFHTTNMNSLERSDRESEVEEWLDERDVDDAWELAPPLVSMGFNKDRLDELEPAYAIETLIAILRLSAYLHPIHSLLHEISEGSGRISEIVGALKNYSFLGQAPVQQVNIHDGIDNTLVILRSKIKAGVNVHKEYCNNLPLTTAYGSELNQVWTNILDNAIDAMNGKGEIDIRTKHSKNFISVEIQDNGPGIPGDVQSKIFDPFFTTKEPGKGTGLGLATTYGIITEKHKGTITVQSKPGCTVFTVSIPIDKNNDSVPLN